MDGTRNELIAALVRELGLAVHSLTEAGLRHRDLRPSAIFVRSRDPLDLVIGGFGSLWLSIPLLALLVLLALLTRPLPMPAEHARPAEPLLQLPTVAMPEWVPRPDRVSETLREVTPVDGWERLMTARRPWFWAALALVLVWAVASR